MSAMLNNRPPCSGTRLSTSSTFVPSATRRRARLEPMKPSPPVMSTRRSWKWRSTSIPAPGASEEKAAELTLLRGSLSRGTVAEQNLSGQAHPQTADMIQELLPVQHPTYILGGISVRIGSLNDRE